MPLQKRVVDYFVVLRVAQTKVESGGRFKQIGLPLVEKVRFPSSDFKDAEFPSDLGCFAFPDGATFSSELLPKSEYSFVLTEGDGGRIYCRALRFWKEIPFEDLQLYLELYGNERVPFGAQDNDNRLYEPFIMVLVSHWPFLNEFSVVLSQIFAASDNSEYSIESILTKLIYETPLPPRGRRIVEFECYNETVQFERPSPNRLPLRGSYLQLNVLFHTLSLNNIITALIAILCEKRILLYTDDLSALMPCIESLCTLIFPFFWQHIYVPVLPAKFTDFIYAPMPFICGVLSSYLPDLSLLEGVVFIDLDRNTVKYHSSDPIPKFAFISANKDLSKISHTYNNKSKPLSAHTAHTLGKKEAIQIRNAFIKFFAKFLKSYKICMNPSSNMKDKFNKEKWIRLLVDKHSLKACDTPFLNLFIEAQLFQCFIDERFDAQANINNYEVLYFDEKIDETIHNKSTPFLLDSTFLHKSNQKYVVSLPSVSSSSPTSFQPLLSPDCFTHAVPYTTAPVLVSEQDLTTMPTMHISWMSVEFFKQKKLYDRHWHSLETRINSQNLLFRAILQFFMKWQDSSHKYITDLQAMNTDLQQTSNITHNTSMGLNAPWNALRAFFEDYCALYKKTFDESKKKSFIPIMEAVSSKENELFVIIQSARNIESMTAKTKCKVEFANKNLLKYSKRLRDKQLQWGEHKKNEAKLKNEGKRRALPNLDDFVTAIEHKDKYEIEHVESTTNFLTNLEIFTTSQPRMIERVKKLSQLRLANFKQYLYDFISDTQAMHCHYETELAKVKDLVDKIDPKLDIEMTMSTESQNSNKKSEEKSSEKKEKERRYSISRELSTISMNKRLTNSHLSIANILQDDNKEDNTAEAEEIKIKIVTDDHGIDRVHNSIFYSDNLWGNSTFVLVLKQCEDGKNVIKQMIKSIEDLAEMFDLQSRSLVRCCQSIKLNISLSAKELEIWKELYTLTERSSLVYKNAITELRESIFELRVMKGELKVSNKLLQRKKGELGSEVQFATRNVQLAYDERNACLRIYRQCQSQWKSLTSSAHCTWSEHELKPLLQQMSSAQLHFKQSDMKWNRSKNILRSVKQKEDLCNGVILDTFRDKEIYRQSVILSVVSHLIRTVLKMVYSQHFDLNKFMLLCLGLDVSHEIDSFIDREITSSAAMLDKENIRWTAKSVEVSWVSSKNAIDSAKAMLDFFNCRVSAAEQYQRRLTKFKIDSTITDLFSSLNKFISDLSLVSLHHLRAIRHTIEPLLHAMKKCMERQNVHSHELISECNTDFNKLEEKLAKSVIECRRLETHIDSLKVKISDKEDKHNGAKKKKAKFKIFEKSKEQLQTELSSTQNKLKQEISNRDRLKAQLQQKSKYRDVLFSKVITDFIRHEEYRLEMNKYIYCIYSKINEESILKTHALTIQLKRNVETINIKNNLRKFVLQNRSSQNVPKIVLDHAIFKIENSENNPNILDKISENIDDILKEYKDPLQILHKKLIFDHSNAGDIKLLELKSTKEPQQITLTYMSNISSPPMPLPIIKQVSSNQQISQHLLEYVTRHSMKGGKHARIDSLHSISRGAHSRKSNRPIITRKIDENKEDCDNEIENGSNVQRLKNELFANGFTGPKSASQSTAVKKRKQ